MVSRVRDPPRLSAGNLPSCALRAGLPLPAPSAAQKDAASKQPTDSSLSSGSSLQQEEEKASADALERQRLYEAALARAAAAEEEAAAAAQARADALKRAAQERAAAAALVAPPPPPPDLISGAAPTDLRIWCPSNFNRWRDQFLLVLQRYSLTDHVLRDASDSSPDWDRMNSVVKSWVLGTLTDDIAEAISSHGTARAAWLAVEKMFLGNSEARSIQLETKFRNFVQGDLSVTEYCRRLKKMADDLSALGEVITDRTLVLNVIRGLNDRFAQARDDLLLEEITLENRPSAPAAALTAQTKNQAPDSSQQPASGSGGGNSKSSNRRSKRGDNNGGNGGGHKSSGAPSQQSGGAGGAKLAAPPSTPWPTYYNPWTGTIQMWPGPRPPLAPLPRPPQQQQQQAFVAQQQPAAAPNAAQQWGAQALYNPMVGLPPAWDQQSLAANFSTATLNPPPSQDWYFDSGATSHMTSSSTHLSHSTFPRCNSSGPLYPLRLPSAHSLVAKTASPLWHRRLAILFGATVKAVQCDNGTEFDNLSSHTFLLTRGIHLRLHASAYWAEALSTATSFLNILPTKTLSFSTPHFALFGKPSPYDHLRAIPLTIKDTAALTFPRIGPATFDFLDASDSVSVPIGPHKFLPAGTGASIPVAPSTAGGTPSLPTAGPPDRSLGARALHPTCAACLGVLVALLRATHGHINPFRATRGTGLLRATRSHVTFRAMRDTGLLRATRGHGRLRLSDSCVLSPASRWTLPGLGPDAYISECVRFPARLPSTCGCTGAGPAPPVPAASMLPPAAPPVIPAAAPVPSPAAVPRGAVAHAMATRGKTGFRVPARVPGQLYHTASLSPVPKTLPAMEEEHDALLKNHTWELVPRPAGANVVTGKWIFKHKFNADGSLERYKARWVLRGFTQRPGPVHQLDVKNAFLHGTLTETCKPCSTPVDTNPKVAAADGSPVVDPSDFRSLAGALQYLTFTRPDIAYAVQQVCLHMHDPREPHLAALKRILRYVRGTLDLGLMLRPSSSSDLLVYTDADWAGCPDIRQSTSGYAVFLGDNLISWSSKCQNTQSIAQWPMEWQRPLGCVSFFRSFILRFRVAIGDLRVLHVPTSSQYADLFTKGLPSSLPLGSVAALDTRRRAFIWAGTDKVCGAQYSSWARWARQHVNLATLEGDMDGGHWASLRSLLPLYRTLTTVQVGSGTATSFWDDAWLRAEPLAELLPALHSHAVRPNASVHEVLRGGLEGHLQQRITRVGLTDKEKLESWLEGFHLPGGEDEQTCMLQGARGELRTSLLYRSLMAAAGTPCPHAHFVVQFFVWLLIQDRIQCKANLLKKSVVQTYECELCHGGEETTDHIIFGCPTARSFYLPRPPAVPEAHYSVFIFLCCWRIWKHRNEVVFRAEEPRYFAC
ncbi:hypothetical protein HU200_063184 [Digitaria exilis]|uniref:Reverse transcriptase zinc-binding domain-containing protein n=1 Tax=Digitaria exilis TaxID=1010633 RepID=A0A835A5E5_9POAL|nr:hypothetical protein HU200_063184 [Digitaria exilis]